MLRPAGKRFRRVCVQLYGTRLVWAERSMAKVLGAVDVRGAVFSTVRHEVGDAGGEVSVLVVRLLGVELEVFSSLKDDHEAWQTALMAASGIYAHVRAASMGSSASSAPEDGSGGGGQGE